MRLSSLRRALAALRVPAIILVLAVVATVGVVRVAGPPATAAITAITPGGIEVGERARGTYRVGGHTVLIGPDGITVSHPRSPGAVWASPRGRAFLVAGRGEPDLDVRRGLIRVADGVAHAWTHQTVEGADVDVDGRLVVSGALVDDETGEEVDYQMFLEVIPLAAEQLRMSLRVLGEADRLVLSTSLDPGEEVHGLGAQHTAFDLRGRAYPIVARSQGVGRGSQPLSLVVDLLTGQAGAPDTTAAPLPHLVTSAPRSLWVEGDDVVVVDLRHENRHAITVWADEAHVVLGVGGTPAAHVSAHAMSTGRMPRPPRWLENGVVAGLSGGTDAVRSGVAALRDAGVDLSAVWIPDWAGPAPGGLAVEGLAGTTLDGVRYPGWEALLDDLAADDIRVLVRATPTLPTTGATADWFAEAEGAGHLVLDQTGDPYLVTAGDVEAGMVDLFRPEAQEWLADLLAEEVLGSGASGFEAALGAALPVDAVTAAGSGLAVHNAYPAAWATTTRMALDRSDLGEDGLVWHQAAGPGSAAEAGMFTVGPQLVDFSRADGLRSALDGLLSGGMSGLSLNHHEIGGHQSLPLPGPLPGVTRSAELLVRSAELATFTPMMRTTQGSHPGVGAQATDPEVADHLARLVDLHRALAPERRRLAVHAALLGLPPVRPPLLVIPEQPQVARQPDVFFLGEDVLVAPVMDPGVSRRTVTLPAGSWVQVWTGEVAEVARNAIGPVQVEAPLGQPAAWAREGTQVAEDLAAWRAAAGADRS